MKLKVRKLIKRDFEDFINQFVSKRNLKYNFRYKYPIKDITKLKATWYCLLYDDLSRFYYAIEVDGMYAGNIAIKNIDNNKKCAEIGYGLLEEYHGSGIMTEAVNRILRVLKRKFGFDMVYAETIKLNKVSARVLGKCGFAFKRKYLQFSKKFGKDMEVFVFEREL